MKIIPVIVRREKETGNLALFFMNWNGNRSWITCFTKSESHNKVSRYYMEQDCVAVDQNDPEVLKFVKFWESLPPSDEKAVICEKFE